MPHGVEQDEDSEEWPGEEVDDNSNKELALRLARLGHPEDEGEHVHVWHNNTAEEADCDIPRNI